MHAAVLYYRVDERRALSCLRVADEEPVLFAGRTRADRAFDKVVADLHHTIARLGVAGQFRPEFGGVCGIMRGRSLEPMREGGVARRVERVV